MPAWINHAIFWHIYPLGFVGAEPAILPDAPVAHRLAHVQDWMGYAIELGASGLALGPIFAAMTHGYDTIDHFRIDPRLGDDADFDALIAAAHRCGLRVVLDGVFNHVGRDFPAFRDVLSKGPQAETAKWFHLTWPSADGPPDYKTFEGHEQLVALNHDEPAVQDYVARVMNHWLDRGADGWRLDAAYATPHNFWTRVLPHVRRRHPDTYIFGEMIHGDYAAFVKQTGVDAVTQYELWKAIWSGLRDRNLFELAWALDRHNRLLDDFVPLTFVGNHDVTRIATQVGDDRHIPHALAILLAVGGTPTIYAGDEQAFRGVKEHRAGGDDAIRPAFPARPDALPAAGWPTYRLHQTLIGLRRRNPWLHAARSRPIHLTNRQMTLESRNGADCLLIALNMDDAGSVQPAPDARRVLAGDGVLRQPGTAGTQIELAPHGWAILSTG